MLLLLLTSHSLAMASPTLLSRQVLQSVRIESLAHNGTGCPVGFGNAAAVNIATGGTGATVGFDKMTTWADASHPAELTCTIRLVIDYPDLPDADVCTDAMFQASYRGFWFAESGTSASVTTTYTIDGPEGPVEYGPDTWMRPGTEGDFGQDLTKTDYLDIGNRVAQGEDGRVVFWIDLVLGVARSATDPEALAENSIESLDLSVLDATSSPCPQIVIGGGIVQG